MTARKIMDKFALPAVFTAVFYVMVSLLGNRSICFFINLYGIPCPGCGMTRSYLHLLRGDIDGAFHYHPLFILPIFLAITILLRKRNYFLQKLYSSNAFWVSTFLVFAAVWVVRMILMFPDREPMVFNTRALFPSIIAKITSAF